jgi:hypothetical protein
MSDQSRALADRFRFASDAFLDHVERFDDHQWSIFVPNEGRTVAALVHHVAWAYDAESAAFVEIANGRPETGWTAEWLDAQNAQQGEQFANAGREETLAELRRAIDLALERILGFTDEQLARPGRHMPGEPERTVAGWIEVCLIGHAAEHLPSIDAAVKGDPIGN